MDLGFSETGSNYAVQAGLEFLDIPLLLFWSTEGNLLKGKTKSQDSWEDMQREEREGRYKGRKGKKTE